MLKAHSLRRLATSVALTGTCATLLSGSPAVGASRQSVPPARAAARLAVRFGELIDRPGHRIHDATVVVEGERVARVLGQGDVVPAGLEVIDLRRFTGIPGLIDAHTHMTYYWDESPGTRPLGQPARHPAVTVYLAQQNARRTLEAGVTTVRDLGAQEYMDVAMRDLVNRGAMVGPRMFVSGYGLHVSRAAPRPGTSAPDPGLADGADAVMRVVRQQLGAGADVVKMYGSTGSYQDVTGFQTFTADEMKAAVDVAHQQQSLAICAPNPEVNDPGVWRILQANRALAQLQYRRVSLQSKPLIELGPVKEGDAPAKLGTVALKQPGATWTIHIQGRRVTCRTIPHCPPYASGELLDSMRSRKFTLRKCEVSDLLRFL